MAAAIRQLADLILYFYGHSCVDLGVRPVERLPEWGQLAKVERARIAVGGPTAAAAVAAKRFGAGTVKLVSPCGDEAVDGGLGLVLKLLLERCGLDVSGMKPLAGVGTSGTAVLANPEGGRLFLHAVGHNARLTPDIDLGPVRDAHAFLVAGVGLLEGFDGEPLASVLEKVQALGVLTAVDTVHPGHGESGGSWQVLEPSLPHTRVLFMSMKESLQFTGWTSPREALQFLLDHGANDVVVKAGKDGALVGAADSSPVYVPAYVVEAQDTCGTGDCFVGVTLALRAAGYSLVEAASIASASSAIVAREGKGAAGVMPLDAVLEFRGSAHEVSFPDWARHIPACPRA